MQQPVLSFAKHLRRNQTDVEKIIWVLLRRKNLGFKFKRQQPIDHYIVDFVCFEKRLVIEIDGGQHTIEKDRKRTEYLEKQNYRIVRFWNNEVTENKESVFQTIEQVLTPPLPGPLPQGDRKSVV